MTTEPIDLDAAQALADAATPGPWESDGDYDRAEVCQTVEPFQTIVGTETTGRAYMSYERLVLTAADSAFIAQARTLVPALIAEARSWRETALDARQVADDYQDLSAAMSARAKAAEVKLCKVQGYIEYRIDDADDIEADLLAILQGGA